MYKASPAFRTKSDHTQKCANIVGSSSSLRVSQWEAAQRLSLGLHCLGRDALGVVMLY